MRERETTEEYKKERIIVEKIERNDRKKVGMNEQGKKGYSDGGEM